MICLSQHTIAEDDLVRAKLTYTRDSWQMFVDDPQPLPS